MKTLNGGRRAKRLTCGFFLLLSTSMAGCYPDLPSMPEYRTPEGRACAKECQRDHSFCVSSCPPASFASTPCIRQCHRKLEECYDLCLGAERS